MKTDQAVIGALLLCLTTCKPDRITTTDPVVGAAADAWSGGTLVLSSPSFTGADTEPLILLGADTLVVRSLGPDSLLLQLPDTNGRITLTIRPRSGGWGSVSVRVHGLATVRLGPLLDQFVVVYPWPRSGNPTALAFYRGQLVAWDLRTLAVSGPLTSDTGLGCNRGDGLGFAPVPSATVPNLVVACLGSQGRLLAVSLAPTAEPPDTGPGFPVHALQPAVHLSRGKWLATGDGNSGFAVYTRSDSGRYTETPESGWEARGAIVSPRGDRIAPTWANYGSPPGVPIYDAATGAAAYHIVAFPGLGGPAAFTPEGDTLFLAGMDSANQVELLAVEATSGTILARAVWSRTIFDLPFALASDPIEPFLYVGGWSNGPYLDVLDRPTLRRVATLRTPTRIAGTLNSLRAIEGWPWTVVVSPLDRRLYAIPMTNAPVQPYVFEFELMP